MSKKLALLSAALLAFAPLAYAQTENADDTSDQSGNGVIDSSDVQQNNLDAIGTPESKNSKTPGDVSEMTTDEGSVDDGTIDESVISPAARTAGDATFVEQASSSNTFEILSSELALQRSDSPQVRTFAEEIIDDHRAAADQLSVASNGADAPVSASADTSVLSNRHHAMLVQLQEAEGAAFDDMYMDMQEHAHVEAVDLFRNYEQIGEDDALRQFAGKTLPTLQEHLDHVQMLDQES